MAVGEKAQLYKDRAKTIPASYKTKAEYVILSDGNNLEEVLRDDLVASQVNHEEINFKVGQGDVDVSTSVVDGEASKMVIKGQTYQNILPEPSLRNSMTDGKSMQKFNEGYDDVNVVDGVAKSAILSGKTLVNLHKLENYSNFGVVLDGGINQHFGGDSSYATWRMFDISMLKPNTEYGVFCWVLENTISENYWAGHIHHASDTVFNPSTELRFSAGETGLKFAKLTTISDFTGKTCGIRHLININTPSSEYVKFRCVIVEYQDGMENWDIPYFEGMQSVKMPVLRNTNGTSELLEDGTPNHMYKSNILRPTEDIVLREVNGAKDTYNALTGEYVQRIGERVYEQGDELNSLVKTDMANTQYELATPIATIVKPSTIPFAYANGHIILESASSEQSLLPRLKYRVVASRTGQITQNSKIIMQHEKRITSLEDLLLTQIVEMDYERVLLQFDYELQMMNLG